MRKIFLIVITLLLMTIGYGQIPQSGYDMPIVVNNCAEHIPLDISVTAGDANESQSPEHRYRRIYFVHGLGGDASAMEQMANAFEYKNLNIKDFPARKCMTSRPEYKNSTGSLISAANDVKNQVRTQANADLSLYNMRPEDAFLIGHSQGGMVLRTMAHLDLVTSKEPMPSFGKGYNGIVTLGSPLQGAQILNNKQMIINMCDHAARCLIAGPTSATMANFVLKKTFGREYREDMSALVANTLLPAVFGDYFDGITNYYQVGASWINELNSDDSCIAYRNMPKVAFYGVEPQDRIFWRTANWLVKNPNSVAPFEANDDRIFYHTIYAQVYMEYFSKYYYHKKRLHPKRTEAWKKGLDWFNTVDYQWQAIIGARKYNLWYECKCPITKIGKPKIYVYYFNASDCLDDKCIDALPVIRLGVSATVKENDGVVLAESAANLPGYTNPPVRVFYREEEYGNYDPQTLIPFFPPGTNFVDYGTSHMQMRNDGGVKEKMFKLLNGEYGNFFRTLPK